MAHLLRMQSVERILRDEFCISVRPDWLQHKFLALQHSNHAAASWNDRQRAEQLLAAALSADLNVIGTPVLPAAVKVRAAACACAYHTCGMHMRSNSKPLPPLGKRQIEIDLCARASFTSSQPASPCALLILPACAGHAQGGAERQVCAPGG